MFNTDQGSQFTSEAFTGRLKEKGTTGTTSYERAFASLAGLQDLRLKVSPKQVVVKETEVVSGGRE
jgi:transposase InsO family protein